MLRRFILDVVACLSIYIPALLRWPVWTWWIAAVPRVNRPMDLYHYFRARELMVHLNIRHIAFFKFAVLVLGTAHYVGCMFFFISRLSEFDNTNLKVTWIEQFYKRKFKNLGCGYQGTVIAPYFVTLYKVRFKSTHASCHTYDFPCRCK